MHHHRAEVYEKMAGKYEIQNVIEATDPRPP